MKKNLFLFFCCLMTGLTYAQEKYEVKGTVTDSEDGEPLIGVSVWMEESKLGVITDIDGKYVLSGIPANSVIYFTYTGMEPVTRLIQGNEQIDIQMFEKDFGLGEIVVVGYGVSAKRDLTGSIVSIRGEDLKTSPDYNPVQALQGKVPGLMMINNGTAGGSPTVRIRGIATINASTDPLYIVDGMFVDNIDFVNPNDVASIEVLKDPSSLAIFGVQGANGVIIITTNRAKEGQTNITYDGYGGVQALSSRDRLKLTNASEFTLLYNELLLNMDPNATKWIPDLLGKGTDWQDEIFRTAAITNHSVSVSRSGEKSSSVFSLGYFLQDGIVKYDSYQRFNARFGADYDLGKYVKAGGNANLIRWDSDPATASVSNAAQAIPTYTPYAPEADHNPENVGSYYTPSPNIQKDVPNPVALMEINKGKHESYGYRVVGNIYGELSFLNDFTFRATGYADVGINLGSQYTPRYDVNNKNSISSHKSDVTRFSRNLGEYTKYQADLIFNYKKNIESHRIGVMAGYTARILESKGFDAAADTLVNAEMWNVPSDLWMLNMGSPNKKTNSDWFSSESFISYLGRINYAYANKYIAAVTFRADGSSKFSPNQRWGYFPSVGLAWVASEESFMDNARDHLDFLKLKASWGKLGNDKIGNYLWFPSINPMGQQVIVDGVTYYLPTQDYIVDKNIHWEVVTGFDVGVEAYLLDSKLNIDVGFYTKTTDDLLAYVSPPASVGSGYAITNIGSIRNSGFEFIVSWRDKIDNVSYKISANGATLRNRVLELGNDNADIVTGIYHKTVVGKPIGSIYGFVQEGIFQNQVEIDSYYPNPWNLQPGDIRYKDTNGDGVMDNKDKVYLGSSLPTFTYGFSLNLTYRDFDTNIDFNGSYGNKIINTKKLPQYTQFNYYDTNLDRWHGEGTSNKEPILDTGRGHNFLPSDNLLESGSYLRLRNLQIGYSLPKSTLKSLGIQSVRIYANAQNLLTFKKNSGYTPEIGGGILDGCIDSGNTYPIPTTYTMGLTVNF